MSKEMTNALAMAEITTETKIGLEDIITVFTSRYEDGLHSSLDTLRQTGKDLQEQIFASYEEIKEAFDVSTVEVKTKHYSVYATISSIDANGVHITLGLDEKSHWGKSITVALSKSDAKKLNDLYDQKDANAKAIAEVGKKIGEMNRKERQIRAKIVEQKIEASNMAGLLDNPELLKLIEG